MSKLRITCLALGLAGVVLSGPEVRAAPVFVALGGLVIDVQDSPFAGGQTTEGVAIGNVVFVDLVYDDATGQASDGFVSFELTDLEIVVPDATQGGSFSMIPVDLNSATRIVFSGPDFQGLVLPNGVTGFGDVDAFDLIGLSFEAEGFNGPDFRFNLGTPVVEFFLPEPGRFEALAAGAAALGVLGRLRVRRSSAGL